MGKKRQDAWTNDDDIILAEIVLRYIRNGETQLEAFKEAGIKLSRTAAACGFRWNKTLRKRYAEGIEVAKRNHKKKRKDDVIINGIGKENGSLEHAILLLKNLKNNPNNFLLKIDERNELKQLKEENKRLIKKVKHYEEALAEIYNIWNWTQNKNEH